jgi:hypothetical protein
MNESEAKKYSFKAFRHPEDVEVELIKKRTSYDLC